MPEDDYIDLPWEAFERIDQKNHTEAAIAGPDGDFVALVYGNLGLDKSGIGTARRIVLCVTACDGIPNEVLEAPETTSVELAKRFYREYSDTKAKCDKLISENVQLKTLLAQTQQGNARLYDQEKRLLAELKEEHDRAIDATMHDKEFCDVCRLIAAVEVNHA